MSPLTAEIFWSRVDSDAVVYAAAALILIAALGALLARLARTPRAARA